MFDAILERIQLRQRIRFLKDQKSKMVCNDHADLIVYSDLTTQIKVLEARELNQTCKLKIMRLRFMRLQGAANKTKRKSCQKQIIKNK